VSKPFKGRARVEGVGFWAHGLSDWQAAIVALRGGAVPGSTASRPVASVLASTERRRAPDSVALALDVALQACRAARRDPAELRSVFASMHGDLGITDYLCSTLAKDPRSLSPTRFHNSVHNAAAGYWAIGTGCRMPYTAIAAGDMTAGAGMLEALVQVECEGRPVLYVAYDIEASGPLLAVSRSHKMLGVALVLAPEEEAAPARLIEWSVDGGDSPTPVRTATGQALSGNAMSPVLPLVEALADPAASRVTLSLSSELTLEVQFTG